MIKLRFFVVLLISLGIICISTVRLQAQEQKEIEKWIEEASVDSQKGAIFNYTYLVKVSYERKKKWGFPKKFTKVYEAIVPSRFTLTKTYTHPLVLIEDSENPVSRESIANARKNLITEIERAEKVVDKPDEKLKDPDGGYWTTRLSSDGLQARVHIFQLVKTAQFTNLQNKEIDGREVVTIDFAPNPKAKTDTALDYTTQIEGQIWIDKQSKRIIRVEGFYLGTFKDMKVKTDAERENSAVLLFLQTKVAEGFWFPQIVRLNFINYPDVFEPVKVEFNFSKYKKSTVDVKDILNQPEQITEKATPTESGNESKANQ